MRVVKFDNPKKGCGFIDSVVRTIFTILAISVGLLLLFLIFEIVFSESKRRAGDGITKTMVVVEKDFFIFNIIKRLLNKN